MTLVTASGATPHVDSAGVLEIIRRRRSASKFRPDPPPAELLAAIIEAACWAPNHHLTEPWRFAVVAGEARRELGETLAAEILDTTDTNPKAEAEALGVRTKLLRSPVIVVVAQTGMTGDPEHDLEDYAACCCATHNLLLAAEEAGLATKWSTGRLVHSAAARRFLGFAPTDRIVAYVYLGYPDGAMGNGRRRPAAEVTTWHGMAPAGSA